MLLSRLLRLRQLDDVEVTVNGSRDECEDEDEGCNDEVSTATAATFQRKLSGIKHIRQIGFFSRVLRKTV